MSGSAMFVQPPGSIPIPMLADADGQCYYASGGISRVATGQPVPAGSYTAGQTIGIAPIFQVGPCARAVGNGSGVIYGVTVIDPNRNVGQVDFLFFNSQPTGTFMDKTECVLTATDVAKLVGNCHITDWTIYGAAAGNSVGNANNIGLCYQLGKTGSIVNTYIYTIAVARASLTLAAGWSYNVRFFPD